MVSSSVTVKSEMDSGLSRSTSVDGANAPLGRWESLLQDPDDAKVGRH